MSFENVVEVRKPIMLFSVIIIQLNKRMGRAYGLYGEGLKNGHGLRATRASFHLERYKWY